MPASAQVPSSRHGAADQVGSEQLATLGNPWTDYHHLQASVSERPLLSRPRRSRSWQSKPNSRARSGRQAAGPCIPSTQRTLKPNLTSRGRLLFMSSPDGPDRTAQINAQFRAYGTYDQEGWGGSGPPPACALWELARSSRALGNMMACVIYTPSLLHWHEVIRLS
jgi:hypothetical protein